MPRDPDVQRLLDESSIRNLLNRYARAIDRQDRELLSSLFWPDATVDYGVYNGPIAGFVEYVAAGEAPGRHWMHHLGTQIVDIHDDFALAETYSLAFSPGVLGDSSEMPTGLHRARYLDRVERRDGEWLIAARRVVVSPKPSLLLASPVGPPTGALVDGGLDDSVYALLSQAVTET